MDYKGDLCYAQARTLGQLSNIQTEARAILEAIRYWKCDSNNTKILESDSLVIVRIITGQISPPWEIIEEVEEICQYIQQQQIRIQHIFREGNNLVDYLKNYATQKDTYMV